MSAEIEDARRAAKSGRWHDAEMLARRIFAGDPKSLAALEIIALARKQSGDLNGAEALLRQAIRVDPAQRWPYGDLARLLIESGRPADAEAISRTAVIADEKNADAHMLLGRLLTDRGMAYEGAVHSRKAIHLAGRHPQLLGMLGRALSEQGLLDDARKAFQEALTAQPEQLEIICALAEVEERAGRFDEATALLDKAEPLARRAGTDIALQRSVLLARKGEAAQALSLLDASDRLSGPALLERGRLLDRLGRHGEAWRDWSEGKQKIASQSHRRYNPEAEQAEASTLLGLARSMSDMGELPDDGREQPLFILGFPRSGTTLVEQILAAHDEITAGGELPFGQELRNLAGDLADRRPAELRSHYLARAGQYRLRDGTRRYFTDKMPLNEFHLPLIRLAFPDAKIIRVVRHPLDVLVSVLSHDMTHGKNCSYRIDDAARHFALVQRQVAAYQEAGLRIDHTLRYEALAAAQEEETTALMDALGLELQPGQLSFHTLQRHAPTPSYAQVREPLNHRSIGRWRHFRSELEEVLPLVTDAMAELGYDV